MENTERTDDGTNQKITERDGTDGNGHRTHGKWSGTGGNVTGRPENDREGSRKYGT